MFWVILWLISLVLHGWSGCFKTYFRDCSYLVTDLLTEDQPFQKWTPWDSYCWLEDGLIRCYLILVVNRITGHLYLGLPLSGVVLRQFSAGNLVLSEFNTSFSCQFANILLIIFLGGFSSADGGVHNVYWASKIDGWPWCWFCWASLFVVWRKCYGWPKSECFSGIFGVNEMVVFFRNVSSSFECFMDMCLLLSFGVQ